MSLTATASAAFSNETSLQFSAVDLLLAIRDRFAAVETKLDALLEQRTRKDWYTPAEVAAQLGKAEFTVREWCRLRAEKRHSGRGPHAAWVISQAELDRFHREGLLSSPLGSAS